mgnify:CR=1 FL=1
MGGKRKWNNAAAANQRAGEKILEGAEKLQSEIDGKDGRPAFEIEDVLGHMRETGIRDPYKAYKDKYETELQKYPGIMSGGYYSDKPFDLVPENAYPIRWLEILGEIFHPLMLKYTDHIKFGLPDAVKSKRYK